jgi:hypothetical protein
MRNPIADLPLPLWQGGSERRRVPSHDMTMGAQVGHHQDHSHEPRPPTPLSRRQPGQKAALSVKGDEQILQVPEPGLGLDDKQRAEGGLPG